MEAGRYLTLQALTEPSVFMGDLGKDGMQLEWTEDMKE